MEGRVLTITKIIKALSKFCPSFVERRSRARFRGRLEVSRIRLLLLIVLLRQIWGDRLLYGSAWLEDLRNSGLRIWCRTGGRYSNIYSRGSGRRRG